MSYKVEVTAASVPELASKLLAMGFSMQGGVAVVHSSANDPVMPEVKEAAPKARKTKAAPEVAEQAPADPTPEPKSAAPAEVTESQPTTQEPASTDAPAPSASEPAAVLDFDKDVAPVVLNAVKVKGKPWVLEVLSQFGVERASQVPDEQLGELVAAMSEGAGA